MSKTLIIIGTMLVIVGVLWPYLDKLGLGRLPGDIIIRRENFTFYFPLITGLLVSILLSLILWFINR